MKGKILITVTLFLLMDIIGVIQLHSRDKNMEYAKWEKQYITGLGSEEERIMREGIKETEYELIRFNNDVYNYIKLARSNLDEKEVNKKEVYRELMIDEKQNINQTILILNNYNRNQAICQEIKELLLILEEYETKIDDSKSFSMFRENTYNKLKIIRKAVKKEYDVEINKYLF